MLLNSTDDSAVEVLILPNVFLWVSKNHDQSPQRGVESERNPALFRGHLSM